MNSKFLAAFLLLVTSFSAAQTAPTIENGFKSFGSYQGGDLDTVNLQTGNLMFHIPIFSYPQRGGKLNMSYVIQGSSKNWQVGTWTDSQHNDHYKWILKQSPGAYSLSQSGTTFVDPSIFELQRSRHLATDLAGNQTYTVDDYAIATGDGAWHWLSGSMTNGHLMTMDGSGIQVVINHGIQTDLSDDTATIILRDGTHYFLSNISVPMPATGLGNNITGRFFKPELVLDAWGTTQTAFDGASSDETSAIDVNGNVLSTVTDTLGRVISAPSTSTSDYSGCITTRTITGAAIVSAPGPDGHNSTLKICMTSFTPTAAFSQPNVDPPSSNVPAWQLNSYAQGIGSYIGSIVMPDGNHWSFDYDNFGNITKITLPTGGSISYVWTEIPDGCGDGSLSRVSRAVSTRTIVDNNGHSYQWNYTWGAFQSGDGTITNYVLDPNGNETAHVFHSVTSLPCDFYETETRSYQGTHASGALLHTVDTHYHSDFGYTATSQFAADVVPDTITTTLPGNKVSKVVRQYDSGNGNMSTFGKVTDEKVYDYGSGAPGALLKETVTTYQWQANSAYLDAGFLDLPASVIVKDGAGCKMSETDYAYDEAAYPVVDYAATVGALPAGTHQSATTPRGNLTTTTYQLFDHSQCMPTAQTAVTSHTRWYDTGVPYQTIDPLGHTTTLSYDPAYKGAYVTQTCSPQTGAVTHCVSGTYDLVTGLLESLTNENATTQASGNTPGDAAHTSSYTYDTSWRLTQAQAPPDPANGGSHAITSFTPSTPNSFPLSVQHQHSVTTTLTDSSTTYFDGLERPYQTQHAVPGNTATVLTTFDGLGHVASVTNPYFSTSDSTYGVTSSIYDGLGRVTQTTKQDGSRSYAAYDDVPAGGHGVCTTTTDEAGKQRRTCSDALGRLVEVDEPGVPATQANTFTFQSDGNVVLYNAAHSSLWSTGTASVADDSFEVQDDGTLDLYVDKWQAGTYATPSAGPFSTPACSVGWAMNQSQFLFSGQCLSSPHGQYELLMQSDGNLLLFNLALGTVTWSSGTYGHPGAYADLQPDGNFVIYNSAGTAGLWATNTNANGNRLELWDNGLIVIFRTVWSSNTSQGSWVGSMAPPSCNLGNILGKTGAIGQGQCFTSPNGRYELILQPDGNLVLYDRLNSPVAIWSTNTSVTLSSGVALVTLYNYDALGNLLCVEQHGDATTGTGCGSAPSNDATSPWRVRRFTYDSFSRLLTAHNPESGTITYSYDADGNLLQKTSPAPNQTGTATQTVSYCYDDLHRVTGKGYGTQSCPLSSPVVTYSYDSGVNAKGKLTSLTDQAGTASYTYDILGRLSAETRTLTGAGGASIPKNLSYEYNLDGSLAKLHYPSGAVVTYTPDSAGRTVSAIDSGNNINYATSAAYGPDGSLTSFISGYSTTFAGIANAYSYNKRLQPLTMSATAPSQTLYSIGYDFHLGNGSIGANNGNVFGIINYKDTTHNRDQTFTYDALNRIISAQNAGTDCTQTTVNSKTKYWGNSYGYDAWGNLLNKAITKCGAENLLVTADAHNWIHASGTDYQYDAAGNMTYDATAHLNYSFDQENRISGASGYTYTYDADGNRVSKSNGTLASSGTLYWYMTLGIVAESDLAGTTTSEYVFFDGERVARKDFSGGTTSVAYYFSDHLKTASVITDAAGTIKAESDYYPWGGELQFTNNDSNHYKFTGKERDTETGLDYFGARYYSNGLGRWVSADWSPTPIPVPYADFGDPQSLNLYQFVGGNPASRTDLDGHDDSWHFFGRELKGFGKAIVNAVPETYNTVAKFINIQIQSDPNMAHVPLMQEMPTVHVNNDDPAEVIGNGVGKLTIIVATGAKSEASTPEIKPPTPETPSPQTSTSIPKEGIYEGPDATAPGKTYVGQSGDIPSRIQQHKASGKFAPGTKVSATEVTGGKTAREIAEHNRIQKLGGVRSTPGSQTSNIRNPIGKNRQHLLEKKDTK